MVKVAVGTSNPSKVEGVRRAFEKFFKDVQVVSVPVETGVRAQPLTFDEALLGAKNRALNALKKVVDADFGVGVEAGMFQLPYTPFMCEKFVDFQCVVIVAKDGFTSVGFTVGFEIPRWVYSEAFCRGREMEEVFVEISGIERIGDKEGAIGFLTRGVLDRATMTEHGVIAALIPQLNRRLYSGEGGYPCVE